MTETAMDHLILDGLEKRFGPDGPAVVEALSLQAREGELLGMLGPSGCGKTTTLRMIGGLIPASSGRVRVKGKDITGLPPHLRDMGVVFQNYALFPHMSVADNLAFGLQMRRAPRGEIDKRVQRALELVQLGGLWDRHPRQLSGGQQQRVALARALVIEPSILLLDEPLSNLDAHLREAVRGEIRDIQKLLGITTLLVTHDQAEALAVCDRIAIMRAGRLEQIGTPLEIYERPANAFVASFVGRVNRIDARREPGGAVHVGTNRLTTSAGEPGRVEVMIRPHRIRIVPDGEAASGACSARGTVRRITFIGDTSSSEIEIDGARLLVERPTVNGFTEVREGETVTLAWSSDDVLVFPWQAPT
jgi:putative spermidine/putrescine transport system ATP-binding protein